MSGAAPAEFVTGFYVGFLSWPILKIVGLYVADLISDCILRPYKPNITSVPSLEQTFQSSYEGSMFDASTDDCEDTEETTEDAEETTEDVNDVVDAVNGLLELNKKEN
jgi:hypothetical protein